MSNKAAKALIFFVIALLAFLVSAVCATEAYNIIAEASMEEQYSNPDNVTLDDVNKEDYSSNNNHYYSNENTLNSNYDGNTSSPNLFNMNIFDLFNSSDDSGAGSSNSGSSSSDSSDVSSFASNIFDELKDRFKSLLGWS